MTSVASPPNEPTCRRALLRKSCLKLTGIVLVVLPFAGWYGYTNHGSAGLLASAVAASVCWFAASLALVTTHLARGPQRAVQGMLLAMLFRLGLPLGFLVWAGQSRGALQSAGVTGMVLLFYFVTLIAETLLALRLNGAEWNCKKTGMGSP